MATGIGIIGIVPGRHVGTGSNIRAIRILVSLVHHRALRVTAISGVSGSGRLLRRLLEAADIAVAAVHAATATGRSVALLLLLLLLLRRRRLLLLRLVRAGGTIVSLGASSWVPWGVI